MRLFMRKVLAVSFISFTFFSSSVEAETVDINKVKLLEIYDLLSQYHLSGKSPDELTEAAILGMINSLGDPHTSYFSDEEFETFMNDLEGSYSGIGIVVAELEGKLTIMEVIPLTPSERAGIQVGDILLKIDGESIKEKEADFMVSKLRGEENTKVRLELMRNNQLYQVDLERTKIDYPSVFSEVLPNDIGYISLTAFLEETMPSFNQQLQALNNQGIKGLILDLRNNPGGLLSAANELASRFILEGPLVWVKDREGKMEPLQVLEQKKESLPLVVLVNESSASASEIVASALQDYQRATLIGTRSFGKGTIQEAVPLQFEGVLKLTIEEYLSPLQKKINHIGVIPDIEIGEEQEQLQAAKYVLSGNHTIQLYTTGDVYINHVKEQDPKNTAFLKEEKWYISTRKLAALFHGKLHYQPDQKEIILQLGTKSHSFYVGASKELSIINGTSYISLEELSTLFPNLQSDKEQGHIQVQVKP